MASFTANQKALRRIVVLNPKGGCGKTTISTQLAAHYSNSGRVTRLFDHDMQSSATHWFAMRQQRNSERCKNLEVVQVHGRPGAAVTRSWLLRVPPDTERVIIDSPASIRPEEMAQLVQSHDRILIPVLPSPIDIQAATYFIRDLLLSTPLNNRQTQIAVLANRSRQNTQMYHQLERFLFSLRIPFLTTLHDLQIYPRTMHEGLSLFDLPVSKWRNEYKAWLPLLRWLDPVAEVPLQAPESLKHSGSL